MPPLSRVGQFANINLTYIVANWNPAMKNRAKDERAQTRMKSQVVRISQRINFQPELVKVENIFYYFSQ